MINMPGWGSDVKPPPYNLAVALEKMPSSVSSKCGFDGRKIADFPWRYVGCLSAHAIRRYLDDDKTPTVDCPRCWLQKKEATDSDARFWNRFNFFPMPQMSTIMVNTGTEEVIGDLYFIARCRDCGMVVWMDAEEGAEDVVTGEDAI